MKDLFGLTNAVKLQLQGVQQNPQYHPEGDCWEHSRIVAEEAFKAAEQLPNIRREIVYVAGLLHDVGKPSTASYSKNGNLNFLGHEEAGVPIARELCICFGYQAEADAICSLVGLHDYYNRAEWRGSLSPAHIAAFRALARPARIEEVVCIWQADSRGTPPLPSRREERINEWLEWIL